MTTCLPACVDRVSSRCSSARASRAALIDNYTPIPLPTVVCFQARLHATKPGGSWTGSKSKVANPGFAQTAPLSSLLALRF